MGGSVLRFDRDNPSRDPVPGGQGREGPTTERADGTVRRPSLDGHREPPGRHCGAMSLGRTAGAVTHLQHGGARAPFQP